MRSMQYNSIFYSIMNRGIVKQRGARTGSSRVDYLVEIIGYKIVSVVVGWNRRRVREQMKWWA